MNKREKVLKVLRRHRDEFLMIKDIAELANMSEPTIGNCIKDLKENGLVEIIRVGKAKVVRENNKR